MDLQLSYPIVDAVIEKLTPSWKFDAVISNLDVRQILNFDAVIRLLDVASFGFDGVILILTHVI